MIQNQIQAILARHERLQDEVADPAIASNPEAAMPLLKQLKALTPLVEKAKLLQAVFAQIEQAKLLAADSETDMREMAEQELESLNRRSVDLEEELKELLIPRDPDDSKNAILEIRAGTGGEEAALFAGDLFRMYQKFAERRRWKYEVMSVSEADAGGLKEVVVDLRGEGAYGVLKWETGVHRVQRVPATEAQGRIHTSAATVAVLPEADEKEVQIRPDDLKIQVYRSSGAGGQHVNTTDSAVRITHIPSGLVVAIQDERSQIKNRQKALKVLYSRLLAQTREDEASKVSALRKNQVGSGDRSEKIRTYNYPQNRVTDHRVDLTLYKLDRVMEGEIEEFTEALKIADRQERLKLEGDHAIR